MSDEDYCIAPCLYCTSKLRNGGENQPMGGTEFIGGGCYGSTITDHGGFEYAINICDGCLENAIDSGHVMKRTSARHPAPKYSYGLVKNVKDQGGFVTEDELLDALRQTQRSDQHAAASSLKAELFGANLYNPKGYIGIAPETLIVFAHGYRHEWRSESIITEWEGWPVEWHFGCGVATTEGPK